MDKFMRILIVDDDQDNAASLGELFEMEGHQVLVVHSGQEAVDAYLRASFDLAFMDVMMPGKNGVESFLEIRALKPTARVYMMSGYSVEELMRQAVVGGALGYIDKPFDPREVLRITEKIGRGGMLLAANADRNAARAIGEALTQGGCDFSLIKSHSDLSANRANDSILLIDADLHLIDEVAVYKELRSHGHAGPAILVPRTSVSKSQQAEYLKDVAVTGILNKPFDPLNLLQILPLLAA
jgi:two-component system, NtrC family, response regulator HydG